METFTKPKELVDNPRYKEQKQKSLSKLSDSILDQPIADLIRRINDCPHCFTLQSCYGHFVHDSRQSKHSLEALPSDAEDIAKVEYRIAYIAVCIENIAMGKGLLERMRKITDIDSENIQYGCADWFWERQVNSYVLQVEPERFKHEDMAIIDYPEALRIEQVRSDFFEHLRAMF